MAILRPPRRGLSVRRVPSPPAPGHLAEGLDVLKERQVVFQLVRKLARAQFVDADRRRSERLWQEVADLDIDPDRIIRLLYGTDDDSDFNAMEAIDRLWVQEHQAPRRVPWRRPAWLGGRPTGPASRRRNQSGKTTAY